jgi:SRSO17 transposase
LPSSCTFPEVWAQDEQRRKKAGVPKEVGFQTKPEIALRQIERARQHGLPRGVVLAHAGYGNDTQFRNQLTEGDVLYFAGIQGVVKVWKPGEAPKRLGARSEMFLDMLKQL